MFRVVLKHYYDLIIMLMVVVVVAVFPGMGGCRAELGRILKSNASNASIPISLCSDRIEETTVL